MALHNTLEATSLADANDVNKFLSIEDIDEHTITSLQCAVAVARSLFFNFNWNLAAELYRRQIVLAQMPLHRLGQARLLHKLNQTDLRGIVAVASLGLVLRHHARPSLQNGRGMHVALIVEELRHADLFSQDSS